MDPAIKDSRTAEPVVAEELLKKLRREGIRPKTAGGDKGFHTKAFVKALRRM